MHHRLKLKIILTKNAKISLFAISAWLLKNISKCEKAIKPCKQREVGVIVDKNDQIEAELFFIFSSANVYLKNKDKITSNLQTAVNKIKLHKKIINFQMLGFHESSETPDFEIKIGANIEEIKVNTVVPFYPNYYISLSGKVLNWNINNDKLKIKNKDFGNIVINYKKNKAVNDVIIKACSNRLDIKVFGSLCLEGSPQMNAIEIKNNEQDIINTVKIPKNIHKIINIFARCQK